MNSLEHLRKFFVIYFLLITTAYQIPTDGAPNPTGTKDVKNPVVFNVWEYARVSGPRINPNKPQSVSASATDSGSTSKRLSPCVWAMTACCGAEREHRKYSCFDALGCRGAWFNNLCTDELLHSALNLISQ